MRFRDLKKQSNKNNRVETQMDKFVNATYPDRIKSFITDTFLIYMPILYILAYAVLGGKEEFQSSSLAQLTAISVYAVIYASFLTKTGQTPGKKAYQIKVVDAKTRENISFVRSLLRFVAFLFSATILFGILTPLVRKDKRALHDLIAKTMVIVVK